MQCSGEAGEDVALGLERNVAAECNKFAGCGLEAAGDQSGEPQGQLRLLLKHTGSVAEARSGQCPGCRTPMLSE